MDYKTTYTYHFKTTQSRITSLIQNKLKVNKRLDRSFQLIDEKLETFYSKQLDILKDSLDYNQLKPFINKIGVRSDYYKKHTLSKILSNEIKEDFEKLNNDKPYKKFIAEIAQMKAVEDGFYNYKNNRPYFDLCYKTDGIEKITVKEITGGYTGLEDYDQRHEQVYPKKYKSSPKSTINPKESNKENFLQDTLTEKEKILLLSTIFSLDVPIKKLLKKTEFVRVMYLTSGLYDDSVFDPKITNDDKYRLLGNHTEVSIAKERENIKSLISNLEKMKVKSIIPELRKLLIKTIKN